MSEQLPSEEIVADWLAGEVQLVEVGGENNMAQFFIGDDPLVIVGLPEEFLQKIARVLYGSVDIRITVSRSKP